MKWRKANHAIKKVAKQNGVRIEDVRREIEIAIAAGKTNPDPKVQAYWKGIPCEGEYPTPEEFITFLSKQVSPRSKNPIF